jgi:hypothetical protein
LRAFQIALPREEWLRFYTDVGGGQFEIIELQYSSQEASRFKRAMSRVQEAKTRILNSDYDGAVALTRNALEALRHELEPADEDPVKWLLDSRTDPRRASEYVGIVTRLRHLSNYAHHELGTPMVFSRAEAQFVVRTMESLLVLLAGLAQG